MAIAVGITAAVGLVAASALSAPKALPPPPPPPPPPQFDVFVVLDKAAKYETDVALLRELRDKTVLASQANAVWDPYWKKLQARLEVLAPMERAASVASASGGGGTATYRSVLGK